MRKQWMVLLALMMTLAIGTTAMANSHGAGQGADKANQGKSEMGKSKADKAKDMKSKMGGLNALQKESVQLRKDLNSAVKELRLALVQAKKDGKNTEEIVRLIPGLKAMKAPLEEALQAQTEDAAEAKQYNEAKKGKNIDAAGKAIEVRTAKLQTKIDALKKALAAAQALSAQLAAIN